MSAPEFRDKLRDCVNRDFFQLIETVDNWFAGKEAILLKRYLDGWLNVHLHIRCGRTKLNAKNFCAVFCGPSRPLRLGESDNANIRLSSINIECASAKRRGGNDDHKQFVFIGNVHIVKNTQLIPFKSFRVIVRLNRLDDVRCGLGEALYFSPLTGLFKFIGSVADRKFVPMVRRAIIGNDQFSNEMVQGGATLMDRFSSNDRKANRRIRAEYAKDMLSRISLRITNDSIDIAGKKSGNLIIEILDVLLGPLNFFPYSIEGMRHGQDSKNSEREDNSNPEAGRLLQESEESRHPISDQRQDELTAQTAPSHQRDGCTATCTHSNNPEGAS